MAALLPGFLALVALSLVIVQPSAQEPARSPEQAAAPQANIFNYGEVDKTCLRWTDGCRNCSRGTGQLPECSNIGIACQPQEKVTCLERAPDGSKN